MVPVVLAHGRALLASDAGGYIAGQVLTVDSGFTTT
jgi:hypothetical protein